MASAINNLRELLLHELNDLYSAEKQIIEALPDVMKACRSADLVTALDSHLQETKEQVQRLKQCFQILGENPQNEVCLAMKGILTEGKKLLGMKIADEVKDAAVIVSCQRVEHYEIAAYGSARSFCELLGETECADLLGQTLSEESHADKKLSSLAAGGANQKARSASAAD